MEQSIGTSKRIRCTTPHISSYLSHQYLTHSSATFCTTECNPLPPVWAAGQRYGRPPACGIRCGRGVVCGTPWVTVYRLHVKWQVSASCVAQVDPARMTRVLPHPHTVPLPPKLGSIRGVAMPRELTHRNGARQHKRVRPPPVTHTGTRGPFGSCLSDSDSHLRTQQRRCDPCECYT